MTMRLIAGAVLSLTTSAAQPVSMEAAVIIKPAAQPMTTSFFEGFAKLDEKKWYVSDGWVNGPVQGCTWSRQAVRVSNGVLRLRVARAPNSLRPYTCGEVQSKMKLGYGWYEARLRSASGSGLNSSIFTYSGPPNGKVHDEIDFEFLGKNAQAVQLNYYVNGRGQHETLENLGFDASSGFNHYAFEWVPGQLRWFINNKLVRTASDRVMPETTGKLYASIWNGTPKVDGWLGRFDAAIVPAEMEVDWIAYTRAGERCRFAESTSCKF